MAKKPKISIIIPVYNEEDYLYQCLNRLCQQKTKITFEIIVVDNNSSDQTKKIAQTQKCRVINERQQGAVFARNKGTQTALGEIIIFIDADCLLPPDYLNKVVAIFERHPEIDAVSGPCVYYDGGRFIYWLTDKLDYLYYLFKLVKISFGVQIMTSANMAVKKKVFEKIGGFNEQITKVVQTEDVEIAIRLQRAGFKIYFDKNLKIFSSFRRIKASPLRFISERSLYAAKLLINNELYKLQENFESTF